MKLRRFGQYQNVTSQDLNAIGEYAAEGLNTLARLFVPGKIYGLGVTAVSGGVRVSAGAAIVGNPPAVGVLETDTTVSLSGSPSGTYVIVGTLTPSDKDAITVAPPPATLPNGQPNPFYDPSLTSYTHYRVRVHAISLRAVPSPYTPTATEIAVATVAWNGSSATVQSAVGQASLGGVTVQDTQTPTGDSGTLAQILSAIANRIKAITGGSSWRDNPATTLSELHSNASRKGANETITGTWTFTQPVTVQELRASTTNILINARNYGVEVRIDEDSSGSDTFRITRGSGGGTTLMVVQNTGNVGIGTTSPAHRLDVAGNVRGTQLIATASEGTAPLQVSSTTKVTNLNADLLDGYDSADFTRKAENATVTGTWTFTSEAKVAGGVYLDKKTASVTNAPLWLRIAQSPTNAANNAGLFEVRWTRSGVHGHLLFSVGANYGDSDVAVNVLSRSQYNTSGPGVSSIRVLQKGTYDQMYVELYVENGDTAQPLSLEVRQLAGYGWQMLDIAPGEIPAGYTERKVTATHPFSAGIDGANLSLAYNGNVGVGVTNPGERLDVSGNVRANRFVSTVGTGTAPFQVSSTTKVDNLNADLLDGYDSSAFARKAENATITGAWTFNNNIAVGAGYTVDGVDISAFKAAYDVHEHNGTDAPKVKAENVLAQPFNGTSHTTTVKAYLDSLQTQINNLIQGTTTADTILVNQLTVNNTISAGTANATLSALTVNTNATIKGDLVVEGGTGAVTVKENASDSTPGYLEKVSGTLRLTFSSANPVRVHRGTASGQADLEIYKDAGSGEIPIYLRFHQSTRYWISLKATNAKIEVRNGDDTAYVDFQAKNITANGTLTATGNVSANGNVTLGNAGAYTTNGWTKGLALPLASAIFWPKGSNTASFGIGVTTGGLYFITSGADDASQGASYPVFLSASGNLGIGTTSPSDKLHVNGNVRANTFIGALQGNADTATRLATSRTISLGGALGGSATFDGSANVTISATINTGAVGTAQLADGSVTTAKLADTAVSTAKLQDSAVTTAKLADSAVTTAKIADAAVTSAKIATGAVSTNQVADSAITTAKLADAAVSTAKLQDSAVTTAKLANSAVTTAKLQDSAVTTVKLADGAVTSNKLASGAVQYAHLPPLGVGSSNRMIPVVKLPLWEGGGMALQLHKSDGWTFLRTILNSSSLLYITPSARSGTTRKARLIAFFTDNARNIYDPANQYWNNGKLTAHLWVRFRDGSGNTVLQKPVGYTWSGHSSARGAVIELTNSEITALAGVTHPRLEVGVFWDANNPSWPTSNITGDTVENNWMNYGVDALFWLRAVYLEVVDEY